MLANGNLSRVSRQSANDKGDNKMKPRAVRRFPGIYLTAEENPGEPQLEDRQMMAVRPIITSGGVPYLQMTSMDAHSTSERGEVREAV